MFSLVNDKKEFVFLKDRDFADVAKRLIGAQDICWIGIEQ